MAQETVDEALGTLSNGLESPHATISAAVSVLANASRQDPAVRARLASPSTLSSLVQVLKELPLDKSQDTADPALRCIANAAADNDEARETITGLGFDWALRCLACNDLDLELLTTKVLYNICSDHEGAQQACYRAGVHFALIKFCGTTSPLNANDANLVIDTLFWVTGHKSTLEPTLSEPLAAEVLTGILHLHRIQHEGFTPETFATVSEVILVFLRDAIVQGQIAHEKLLPVVRQIIRDQESLTRNVALTGDLDDVKLLTPLNASLVWCLSDIAANPEFVRQYSSQDEVILEMISEIKLAAQTLLDPEAATPSERMPAKSEVNGSMFISSCQVLGNLFWALTPDAYACIAEQGDMHEHLFAIVAIPDEKFQNVDALHSMAGLLVQLSRPSERARQRIGDAELASAAINRLVKHQRSEIRHDSIKLLKALGKDCPPNQRRFADLAREAMLSLQEQNGDSREVDSVMELPT